jgi:hypothetical protein
VDPLNKEQEDIGNRIRGKDRESEHHYPGE